MKYLLFFFISLMILSCTKNQSADRVIDPPPPALDTTQSKVIYLGGFNAGPFGTAMGKAKIVNTNGKLSLRLEDFTVNNGPDLKVYLSKEIQPLNFIRLGNLKAVSGVQEYPISGMPDFMDYKYALIHCEQYNHLFGSALLLKQ